MSAEEYAARLAYSPGQVSFATLHALLEEIDENLAELEAQKHDGP